MELFQFEPKDSSFLFDVTINDPLKMAMNQAIKFFCKETQISSEILSQYCAGEFQFKQLLRELFVKNPEPSSKRDENILILMKCYHKIFIEKDKDEDK
jgi:hypothetical protein